MSRSKEDGFIFHKDPTETAAHVKYAMASVSRFLARNPSKTPSPQFPFYITDKGDWKEVQFMWTAFMVFGENLNFDNNSIKTNWERNINSEVGFSSRYSKSSLYETQFKHYVKPYMLDISKTAALYDDISGFLFPYEQIELEKKRQLEEKGLSKQEIQLKRENERPQRQEEFRKQEEAYKQSEEKDRKKEEARKQERARYQEEYRKQEEDRKQEKIRKQEKAYNDVQKGFREKAAMVKYTMAIASRKLAKRSKPSPDKPIFISATQIEFIAYQWTAFMLFGEEMGFNNDSIVIENEFCLKNQIGVFSRFSNDSLYEREFKIHVKKYMLDISKTAALYEDIPGFLSEKEQSQLEEKRKLDEIGLSEKEIEEKREKERPLRQEQENILKQEMLGKQNEAMEADDNDKRKYFRKQAANVKYALAIASRKIADFGIPTPDKPVDFPHQNFSQVLHQWTAFMLFGERLGFNNDSIKVYINEKRIKDQIGFFSTFSKSSLYETQFKHHVKPYMLEISKTAALYDDISGYLSEEEQIELNKQRQLDEIGLSEDEIDQKREAEKSQIDYLKNNTNISNNMEQKNQTQVLINAVNKYLLWLEKDVHNGHEYEVTFFMWMHHLTAFGKKRAIDLTTTLTSESYLNPMQVLQNHFKKDSTLDDYSLDTYLLESILENQHLFLISKKFTDLKTLDLRQELQKLILSQPSYTDTEYAFMLAQLYENDIDTEEHMEKACMYYAIAMQDNHEDSYTALMLLAKKGISEAQYCIGTQYYHPKSNLSEAITWCLLAAEQKHIEAYTYLITTEFSVELYLDLAKKYENGDGVNKNVNSAILFYKKACDLNDIKAAFCLGELYRPNFNINQSSLPIKDATKSFNYYLIAAKQKNEAALEAMIQITQDTPDNNLKLDLADTYLNIFEEPVPAFTCFKQLADKKVTIAIEKLNSCANSNAKNANIIGKLYESDTTNINNATVACKYYLIAMQSNDKESYDSLVSLATKGCSEAQYIIGVKYYHNKQNTEKAIYWCLLAAEQKHPQAITYLFDTKFSVEHYLRIANAYREGSDVRKNMVSAVAFYEKASALNSNEATLCLGQLYHPTLLAQELRLPVCDPQKSFSYFSILAKQKNETALNIMKDIVEQYEDNQLKFELANIYLEIFDNSLMGLSYLKCLADSNFSIGTKQLDTLTNSNPNYAYHVAQLYEKECNLEKAFKYYATAMLNTHEASHEILKSNLTLNNSEAQYAIGYYYYDTIHQIENAIHWCILAAEQQHKKAIDYLFNTKFDAKHCLEIAKKYEQGNEITKNLGFAIDFYKKACDLEHKDAAIRLGQLSQLNLNDSDDFKEVIEKNDQNAFNYYLIAAKQKDKSALEAMVKIANRSNDNSFKRCLGNLYLKVFEEPELALHYFKHLADNHCEEAIKQLKMLTKNPEYANIIAKLYEEETRTENNLHMAAYYYVICIQYSDSEFYRSLVQSELNNLLHSKEISEKELIDMGDLFYVGKNGIPQDYPQAMVWYEQACTKNSAIAHYCIGVMYENAYGVKQNITTAARYFQLAEDKGHAIATIKIEQIIKDPTTSNSVLASLLQMNEVSDVVFNKNHLRVLELHSKLSVRGVTEASMHLGQFFQIKHEGFPQAKLSIFSKNEHLAFESYLTAARDGDSKALVPLERLAESQGAKEQRKLSMIFLKVFNDKAKSDYWNGQAEVLENCQFNF